METTELLYKVTGPKGEAPYQSTFTWPLPTKNRPGKWQHSKGKLELCKNGLYVSGADNK